MGIFQTGGWIDTLFAPKTTTTNWSNDPVVQAKLNNENASVDKIVGPAPVGTATKTINYALNNVQPTSTPTPPPANNGGGNNNSGGGVSGKENVDWYTNEFGQKVAMNQGGSNGGGIDTRMLDDAYNNLFGIFSQQENTAKGTANSAKENISSQYMSDVGKTESERDKQMRELQKSLGLFQESGSGAVNDLVGQYNALEQRANVRYGGGSLGDLMRELAAKEYYKQTGNIKKQQLAGESDFAMQQDDAKLFFQQKISDLDLWKKQAMSEVETRLQQQLDTISAMRGQSQMDKANKQLELLQRAQEQARQITAMDLEFKNGLLSNYIENAQTTMGRAFTPQEIAALVPQFFTPQFNTASQAFSNVNQYNPSALRGNEEDELNKIMGQPTA